MVVIVWVVMLWQILSSSDELLDNKLHSTDTRNDIRVIPKHT